MFFLPMKLSAAVPNRYPPPANVTAHRAAPSTLSITKRRVLTSLRPTEFEDVVAVNALYRPGPMQFIDRYVARKHGEEPVEYIHPKLESILKETYGIIVYQEQIIRLLTDLAGYSSADADQADNKSLKQK